MKVVAFDPSLVATGVWIDSREESLVIRTSDKDSRFRRLGQLHQQVVRILQEERPDLVAVEGYAFGIKNSRSLTVQAEVGGIIRSVATILGARVIEVPTTTWRSKILGSHMVRVKKKTAVERAVYLGVVKTTCGRRFSTCDEADAYMIAEYAKRYAMVPA